MSDPELPQTERADRMLVALGHFGSRAAAQAAIAAGLVVANGKAIRRPAEPLSRDAVIVSEAAHPYVSRGGLKLARALDAFGVDPAGLTCLDLGASTGGLRGVGAAHVLVATLLMLPAFLHALRPLGITGRQLLASNARSLLGICLMVPVGLLCVSWLDEGPVLVVVGGMACLLVYVPIVLPLRHLIPKRDDGPDRREPQLPAAADA